MEHDDNKGGGESSPIIEQRSKRRDDTPSFIRNVQTRAELLNPQRSSGEAIPVLSMPPSVRLWRRVRWPLFVLVVIIVLVTVGWVTNDFLVARRVEKTIAEAQNAERFGVIKQMQSAGDTLETLANRHPKRANAQAAWAWQAVLQGVLMGPQKELSSKVAATLNALDGDQNQDAIASRAGHQFLLGNYESALTIADKGLAQFAEAPRLTLVRAWALNALGKSEQASEVIQLAIKSDEGYRLFLIAGIAIEADAGDRLAALSLAHRLLSVSPGHLYGALMTIKLALPDWGGPALDPQKVTALLKDIVALQPQIASAPPKLSVLGHYLNGRVSLMAENLADAIRAFSKVVEFDLNPEFLAWYASAIVQKENPAAALAFLDRWPKAIGPEVLDVRATCLATYHRVDQARILVDKLSDMGIYGERVEKLRWLLAVRSGNVAAAKAALPDDIGAGDRWPALELYFQLKEAGDKEGIDQLAEAFNVQLASCATAIRAWHSKNTSEALTMLGGSREDPTTRDICVDALAQRLLRGNVPTDRLAVFASRVHKEATSELFFDVDCALATWFVEGRDAAAAILDRISNHHPEGKPLVLALGRAYLAMDLPDKALKLVEIAEDPEKFALRILAAQSAKQKAVATKLVRTAQQKFSDDKHPAYAFFAIKSLIDDGKATSAADVTNQVLSSPPFGRWTGEIAELGAKSLNYIGSRAEADRLLQQIYRKTIEPAGIDEAWEIRLAQIRLNVNRGGKFMFRALFLINELKEAGLKDARLSYYYALAHLTDGNERIGLRFLSDTLRLDPTHKYAYKKLAEMNRLGEDLQSQMKKFRPEYTPSVRR